MNRTGTYVAFDGQGEENPTLSDYRYYALLMKWRENPCYNFNFTNSHEKTYSVRDTSSLDTLKKRLCERLSASKNMLIILSDDTRKSGSMLSYEIATAVDFYKIPLILSYVGCGMMRNPQALSNRWPNELSVRIKNETAKAIHIPFRMDSIYSAINRFGVNDEIPPYSLTIYTNGF